MLFADDFRCKAREGLRGKWALAVGTGFVASLFTLSVSINSLNDNEYMNDILNFEISSTLRPYISTAVAILAIFAMINFFFGGAITLGYVRFNKNLIQGTNPQFNNLFSRFNIFWKAFGMQLVMGFLILFWTLLFIIPGIIKTFSYAMTPYILDDYPEMGITEAISESRRIMDGNKWRLFCLEISFIGWAFLSVLTFGIGYLWLHPYMQASIAAFYFEVSGRNNAVLDPESITEQI